MTDTVRIAHLSDVHLPPLPPIPLRLLNMKRALGWLNWQRKRRAIHRREALDRIVADVKAQAPDHILVSGDLINLGLPQECVAALAWLQTLGAPNQVSVVPGNHDIYSWLGNDPGVGRWVPYMRSDEAGVALGAVQREKLRGSDSVTGGFPYVRRIGPVALIGLNSAEPGKVGYATGRLGPPQIERLACVLERTGALGLVRLVAIHHPPLVRLGRPNKGLIDAGLLENVLERAGAELVVYGHNHRRASDRAGRVRIEGIASASAVFGVRREPAGCYNLITISKQAGGAARIAIEPRGIVDASGTVGPVGRSGLA